MNIEDNQIIINIINQQSQPLEKNELMLMSGLETEEFNNAVSYLESRGDIVEFKKNKVKYLSAPQNAGYVKAVIVRNSGSFSFARPTDQTMADIYIHSSVDRGAMPGDTVLLRNVRMEYKGLSGEVYKIIEKGSRTITGTFFRPYQKRKIYYIIPDSGFNFPVLINKDEDMGAVGGDKIKAVFEFNERTGNLSAKVVKIYGEANSAKVCADAIIDANGIPSKFTVAVKHEAAIKAAQPITDEEIAKRLDLREEAIFTIDGEDAKDLDDAISVKKLSNGGWELGVHIADVSHYVTEGCLLDEEAMERGTSIYFADRVIPMLPVEISNGCCSLNAGTKKLTFSAIITLDEKAEILDYRFAKSVIISKVRGVYSEVNKILDGTADESLKEKYSPVYESIFAAEELAEILKNKAKQRGELEIESTELKFILDESGVCVGVSARERGNAEEMIEQFMVTANRTAALYAKSALIPFVYRVHEAPDPTKLEALAELAAVCGFSTRRLKEGVHQTDLAELINKAKETKYSRLISTQVLRSMAKARYDDKPLGHFGLSLSDYCHFTSPIRRYPDTSIHRILTDLVSGVPIDVITRKYEDFAKKSASMSSERELRAMRVERESEKFYAAEYMSAHIGEVHTGVISGVTGKGLFVAIENGIEGFVNLAEYASGYFEYNGSTSTRDVMTGISYSIGDAVNVKVASASVSAGTIDFYIIN